MGELFTGVFLAIAKRAADATSTVIAKYRHVYEDVVVHIKSPKPRGSGIEFLLAIEHPSEEFLFKTIRAEGWWLSQVNPRMGVMKGRPYPKVFRTVYPPNGFVNFVSKRPGSFFRLFALPDGELPETIKVVIKTDVPGKEVTCEANLLELLPNLFVGRSEGAPELAHPQKGNQKQQGDK